MVRGMPEGAIASIGSAADADDDPRFLHALLCHVGLPRSAVAERTFVRTAGKASLLIEAGQRWTGTRFEAQPLPYGTRPRLALVHICSEAVRTKRREIDIGRSTREFLERLHIRPGGTDMRLFRRQMMALAACRMTFGFGGPDRPGTGDLKPIKQFDAWLVDEAGQQVAWPGELVLDADFLATLLEHAVPLDPAAIVSLMNSALALDLYFWLAHRLCRVRTDQGTHLSWENLRLQFGHEYKDAKDFRKRFLGALRKVLATYRAARVDQVRGGLRLLPSPSPIAKTSVIVKLPAPAADNPAKELRPAVPELPLRHRITEDGLDKLRDACPGWDRQWLVLRYLEFMADKPAPKNADASLVVWGRKFTKGKAP
jgi:hypothetical protein